MATWKLKLPSSYTKAKRKLSAATKAKISKALKGKKRKPSKHPHKGHRLSAAARAKISKALRGKKHAHKGHRLSAAARAKISKALKGKKHAHKGHTISAATRAKISAALKKAVHKGHPMSPATRAKLSAAAKLRDRALARAHRSTATKPKTRKPIPSWKNPIKVSRYRFVTANARKMRPGLLRVKRFRHRGLNLHHPRLAHRVWRRRRRR